MTSNGYLSAVGALLAACGLAVASGQTPASGGIAPVGPPERPPVRVDAGGACVVDLTQRYTMDGTLSGELRIDYRILVAGPCGAPAGTFAEEWIAHGRFSGMVEGREATAAALYTAQVTAGGVVDGIMELDGGIDGTLDVRGELAAGRLTYEGVLRRPRDGGG